MKNNQASGVKFYMQSLCYFKTDRALYAQQKKCLITSQNSRKDKKQNEMSTKKETFRFQETSLLLNKQTLRCTS